MLCIYFRLLLLLLFNSDCFHIIHTHVVSKRKQRHVVELLWLLLSSSSSAVHTIFIIIFLVFGWLWPHLYVIVVVRSFFLLPLFVFIFQWGFHIYIFMRCLAFSTVLPSPLSLLVLLTESLHFCQRACVCDFFSSPFSFCINNFDYSYRKLIITSCSVNDTHHLIQRCVYILNR